MSISKIPAYVWLIAIIALSLPFKLMAAQNMVWDMDIVPVIVRGLTWLEGGAFPAYGTLSSVAAYNMPGLVWLHLPAMLITRDPFWVMVLTLLAFNIIATWYGYRIGAAMWHPLAGLLAAALFTFSETGISSAYTAWAQLLLPGFFVMTFYHLWQWIQHERGIYLAGAGIIATLAFMTHFTAVLLYPAMLIVALITRAKWQWRWLMGGAAICLLMFAPYLLFQIERDFVDLRAFFTQDNTIAPEVLAEYDYLKPESGPLPRPATDINQQPAIETLRLASHTTPMLAQSTIPSRFERGLQFIASIPAQLIAALMLVFQFPAALFRDGWHGQAVWWHNGLVIANGLLMLAFAWALLQAVYQSARAWMSYPHADARTIDNPSRWAILRETAHGRALVLMVFLLVIVVGLIATGTPAWQNATYYTGIYSLQWVLVAYGLTRLPIHRRGVLIGVLVLVIGAVALWSTERVMRLAAHDDNAYSAYNAWLYRHIDAAVDWVAQDWQRTAPADATMPVIAYDIMPAMRHFWWVPAWHTVDPLYRMGMSYDVLLASQHGIENRNADAIGYATNPDYIITYNNLLDAYDLSRYTMQQIGPVVVFKPLS